MTTRQFAARMGITQSSVVALEKSEAEEKISLATLRRAAEALDCELQYVLVPRRPLADRVSAQARAIAIENLSRVKHTMRLEAQGTGDSLDKRAVSAATANILGRPWKYLWDR
jgi:predicted DNA-binding mobile mystery protein A